MQKLVEGDLAKGEGGVLAPPLFLHLYFTCETQKLNKKTKQKEKKKRRTISLRSIQPRAKVVWSLPHLFLTLHLQSPLSAFEGFQDRKGIGQKTRVFEKFFYSGTVYFQSPLSLSAFNCFLGQERIGQKARTGVFWDFFFTIGNFTCSTLCWFLGQKGQTKARTTGIVRDFGTARQ